MGTQAIVAVEREKDYKCVGLQYGGDVRGNLKSLARYKSREDALNLIRPGRIEEISSSNEISPRPKGWYKKIPIPEAPSYFFEYQPFSNSYTWDEVKPFTVSLEDFKTGSMGENEFEYVYIYCFTKKDIWVCYREEKGKMEEIKHTLQT